MPEVNLLSAAAVLFRGGTYTELSDWCQTMGIQMIGSSAFYNIQKAYLYPAIEHVYTEQRNALLARVCLEQMEGKRPHLCGDGRCDSPGFNAKYCHYTFMLDSTKEILHTELVQVRRMWMAAEWQLLMLWYQTYDRINLAMLTFSLLITCKIFSVQRPQALALWSHWGLEGEWTISWTQALMWRWWQRTAPRQYRR